MLSHFIFFIKDLIKDRHLIFQLTKRDFISRYLGSHLGLLWAFIQPSITILIFWFVFQVGFKSKPVGEFPFILWLITGMIPWFFFSEAFGSATGSVMEYSYLVKKVVFRVSTLPIVKILTALFIHIFFIGVIFVFFFMYRFPITIYALQLPYYLFAMIVLLLGLSWMTSALNVFLKDIGQAVMMSLQFGFWLTPIFWSIEMIPAQYQIFLKLNPVFYITEGYRNAFIYKSWFWEHWEWSLYFWSVTGVIFVFGGIVFRKLRPHFADII